MAERIVLVGDSRLGWGLRETASLALSLLIAYIPVKAKGTSSLCPGCRVKLSPSGHRLMKCPKCGPEKCAGFTRSRRKPSHETRGEE